MNMAQLVRRQFQIFKPNTFMFIMVPLIILRTFLSGNAIYMTGICAAFLPFFSQARRVTCVEDADISEEREVISKYIFSLLLVFIGLFSLYGITLLGSRFYPGYVENPYLQDTFLLVTLVDVVFVSIVLPTTYVMRFLQKLMVAGGLFLAAAGVMLSARYIWMASDGQFLISLHPLICYLWIAWMPLQLIGFLKLDELGQKRRWEWVNQ